jgi:hypothetical protein
MRDSPARLAGYPVGRPSSSSAGSGTGRPGERRVRLDPASTSKLLQCLDDGGGQGRRRPAAKDLGDQRSTVSEMALAPCHGDRENGAGRATRT